MPRLFASSIKCATDYNNKVLKKINSGTYFQIVILKIFMLKSRYQVENQIDLCIVIGIDDTKSEYKDRRRRSRTIHVYALNLQCKDYFVAGNDITDYIREADDS